MAADIDDSKGSWLRSGDSECNWIEGIDLPPARSWSGARKAMA